MSLKNQNPRTKDELHFDSEVTVNSTTRQPKPSNPDSAQLQQKPFLPIVTHAVVWNWASTSSSTSTSFQMKTHRRTQVSADSKQATHQPTIKYPAWHLARNAAAFEVSSLKKTEGHIKFVKCVNLYPLRQHVLDFYSSFFVNHISNKQIWRNLLPLFQRFSIPDSIYEDRKKFQI